MSTEAIAAQAEPACFTAALQHVQTVSDECQRVRARLIAELERLAEQVETTGNRIPVFAFTPPVCIVTDAGEGKVKFNLMIRPYQMSVPEHGVELTITGTTASVRSRLLNLHGVILFDNPDVAVDEILRRLAICAAALSANIGVVE